MLSAMADKNKKEPSPQPLLLMSSGGLNLNSTDQPSLIPVMHPQSPVLDEDAEADSFVCQEPTVKVNSCSSVDKLCTEGGGAAGSSAVPPPAGGMKSYFQSLSSSAATTSSDPFAHVAYLPPPQPIPAAFSLSPATSSSLTSIPFGGGPSTSTSTTTPLVGPSSSTQLGPSPVAISTSASSLAVSHGQQQQIQTSSSLSSAVDASTRNQQTGWTLPPVTENAPTNIYRQKGPMTRYAQPPFDTYGLNATPLSSGSMTAPPPPPPPSFGQIPPPPPPSGFAPPPFSTPGGVPGGVAHFPGTSSQPPGHPAMQQPGEEAMLGMGLYQPVSYHWGYCKMVEGREVWCPFSRLDSSKLEERFIRESNGAASEVVSTDGGRYDVEVTPRLRRAVYWEEDPFTIQRCSWFYKREKDNRYVPFDEGISDFLEENYKNAVQNNDWHKRIELPGRDSVVMHNSSVMVHFQGASPPDEWGNVQTDQRPRVVKRGIDEFGNIDDGEPDEVDHLVFILHGIGETCDAQYQRVIECVDDFRSIGNGLMKSHFGPYVQSGHVHRVEFLPVFWNKALHSETSGVDRRMKAVTLPSTHKLRSFVNNTLIDILFYTSPNYCQIICDTVSQEMNRLFQMFLSRNPTFSGEVSVAGHSLGGSILFDLLLHQQEGSEAGSIAPFTNNSADAHTKRKSSSGHRVSPESESSKAEVKPSQAEMTLEQMLTKVGLKDKMPVFEKEQIDLDALLMFTDQDLKDLQLPMGPRRKLQQLIHDTNGKKERKLREELRQEIRKEFEDKLHNDGKKTSFDPSTASQNMKAEHPSISVDYICSLAGTGQPSVHYHQLEFSPSCLFALGSPIAVFLSVRGVESVGETFRLPTCPRFLNVFHPFDPVAYRMEPLINGTSTAFKPVLIPHHKGRKRLHLELKESITRMGQDLKQRIVESLRSTWHSLHEFALAHRRSNQASDANDSEQGLEREVDHQVNSIMTQFTSEEQQNYDDRSDTASVCSSHDDDIPMGQLNEGRRVDFVLQEAPIESFNDYLFALASHSCYWRSEDTVLLLLKEIYSPLGISPIMPGPDGRPPKLVMPPAVPNHHSIPQNPQQHSRPLTSFIGSGLPTSVPLQATSSSSSHHQPLHPPPGPNPMQGPLSRVTPLPFGGAGGGSESQGSSRSSTPPVGGLTSSRVGPPPKSGFIVQPLPPQ